MRGLECVEVRLLCEGLEVVGVMRSVKDGGECGGEGWSLSVDPRMREMLWRKLTREKHLVKKSVFC